MKRLLGIICLAQGGHEWAKSGRGRDEIFFSCQKCGKNIALPECMFPVGHHEDD